MQREWEDPRDHVEWLVTLSPFGWRVGHGCGDAPRRITIAFHHPGQGPIWTTYELGRPVIEVTDQEMMDLLDAARRQMPPSMRRAPRFSAPPATDREQPTRT